MSYIKKLKVECQEETATKAEIINKINNGLDVHLELQLLGRNWDNFCDRYRKIYNKARMNSLISNNFKEWLMEIKYV